jgi:hypothetical protein
MWCSHEIINIDNNHIYKGIKFLFLDFSYKVGITRGPKLHASFVLKLFSSSCVANTQSTSRKASSTLNGSI